MEVNGKRVNPYRGIWIAFIMMFVIPAIAFFLTYYATTHFFDHPFEVNINICLSVSGFVGVLFVLISLLSGDVRDIFLAFIDRVQETRVLFDGIFTKEGWKWYWRRFLDDGGIIFWVMILFLLFYAAIGIIGTIGFYNWYI